MNCYSTIGITVSYTFKRCVCVCVCVCVYIYKDLSKTRFHYDFDSLLIVPAEKKKKVIYMKQIDAPLNQPLSQ